jgi:hypothetical protein
MPLTVLNAIFLDVTPCGSCKNLHYGGVYHLLHQGDKNQRARSGVSSNQQPKHAAKKYRGIILTSVDEVLS